MSVATVMESKATGKKPHYKDYVSFLENYKNGRKEDQNSVATTDSGVSFSLSNSSNNSSSSIYSDLTDAPSKSSFKEYLDNYNNKRFSSVLPPNIKKQEAEAKTMKTEVFIEISNSPCTVTKVVDVSNPQNKSNVSKVSKMFENNVAQNENVSIKTVPPSGKVNTFNFEQKEAGTKPVHKKFDNKNHKVPLKKANSICEKSKVFEDTNNQQETKKLTNGEASRVFQYDQDVPPPTNGCLSPKPLIKSSKPVLSPKIIITQQREEVSPIKTNGVTSPKPSTTIKPIIVPKIITETLVLQQKEDINSAKVSFTPPVCPPPPPPVPQSPPNGPDIVPPPPPPPPMNLTVKRVQNSPPKGNTLPRPKAVVNGQRKNDAVDGVQQPVIDKNDPRMKKLVYGALREMYGTYHDKANDYIATLPRNRVKKNNGLDSIINSIASQGGLEKLNGRANPSVETD